MNTTKTTDLSQFILARRSVTIGSGYEGTEIDMPFGVLLVVQGNQDVDVQQGPHQTPS